MDRNVDAGGGLGTIQIGNHFPSVTTTLRNRAAKSGTTSHREQRATRVTTVPRSRAVPVTRSVPVGATIGSPSLVPVPREHPPLLPHSEAQLGHDGGEEIARRFEVVAFARRPTQRADNGHVRPA